MVVPRLRSPFPSPGLGSAPARRWCPSGLLALAVVGSLPLGAGAGWGQTGPVRCTTTIEAPLISPGQSQGERRGPREVTRCGVVGSTTDLVEQRYFTYRSPFARGVDIISQITDFFGVAWGGRDKPRLMGFGFPDQAVIWDGSAIENTTTFLLDQQVPVVPRRTADLATPFSSSLRGGSGPTGDRDVFSDPANGWSTR